MQVLTTTLFPHRYARGPQRSARGDLACKCSPPRPFPTGTLEGRNALPEETWQASLARCLVNQSWIMPESVRTIDAVVPIVTFATRFVVAGASPKQVHLAEL